MLFLALEEVGIVKITPRQIPTISMKNFFLRKNGNYPHSVEFPLTPEHYLVKI